MLDQILNSKSIAWMLDKATYEKPYPEVKYAEYTFSGTLPSRMSAEIRKVMESHYRKDSTFSLSEYANGTERCLVVRFGNYRSNQNNVVFSYSIEEVEE